MRRGVLVASVALAAWLPALVSAAFSTEVLSDDDNKIIEQHAKMTLGPQECAECHDVEFAAWEASHHSHKIQRKPKVKEMRKKLGIRRIQKEPSCLRCHYTPTWERKKVSAKFAVSCESCHGPASDWISIHDDYGDADRDTETPAARQKRRAAAAKAGLRHPDVLYELAVSCFECHTVDDERAVEVGGHPIGTGFELLTWSQGEVRHNYLASDGDENAEASAERKRLLFGLGRLMEVQFSLAALEKAKKAGPYFDQMKDRVVKAIQNVKSLDEVVGFEEAKATLAAVSSLDLEKGAAELLNPTGRTSLKAAAGAVEKEARRFAKRDGKKLGKLDSLLPSKGEYRGKAQP